MACYRFVCSECLHLPELYDRLASSAEHGECDYCFQMTGVDLAEVARVASEAIRNAYYTIDEPWSLNGPPQTSLDDLLLVEENVGKKVAADLAKLLIEQDPVDARTGGKPFFGRETTYERYTRDRSSAEAVWNQLTQSLRLKGRFFNTEVRGLIERLFGGKGALPFGLEVLSVPCGERPIYRVRRAEDYDEAFAYCEHPDRKLGAPPMAQSTAGRMNVHGSRVFYGSFSGETALAEVRPLVGEYCAIGRFEIERPLRLLNLPASGEAHRVSCFDRHVDEFEPRIAFFAHLDDALSRAVLPSQTPLEYVASQALAEYLRTVHELDGIIYSSAQDQNIFRGLRTLEERVACANVALFEPGCPSKAVGDHDPFTDVLRSSGTEVRSVTRVSISTLAVSEERQDYPESA